MGYLAETLNRYCDLCASFGIKGAVANRVGSYLEAPDEVEAALERTEPELVAFAPDVGHWAYAGGDPVALVRAHRDRITYPRLKDFDRAVYQRTVEERLGFASFARAGGFKELGAGGLDLEGTLLPLENAEYAGWVCVELELTEQPPGRAPPSAGSGCGSTSTGKPVGRARRRSEPRRWRCAGSRRPGGGGGGSPLFLSLQTLPGLPALLQRHAATLVHPMTFLPSYSPSSSPNSSLMVPQAFAVLERCVARGPGAGGRRRGGDGGGDAAPAGVRLGLAHAPTQAAGRG